ncbi:DNA (cytosine-5-)-methyltransferase [Bittarella massiliensis (ex Durand et al. 2017)]|mgnify:FL=1|uniref:DNA (cytosine-5-)-methyltransferase n=1 Tax=Bittarella massiliensis (ex Durand et al. 2017) TaxID=1720313 RepID=UPI001AA0BB55|nr:DNA (cytosine-5-)-methyltransferase [Bittarella massiliensis (ex Durand et al. 2017)]
MANNKKNVRVVELFAGVGGFRVGLERCAKDVFRTVWANQWEPGQKGQWAYKCYSERFGADAHCVNKDISTVIEQVPEHDLLVGGFPCQDYSVASTGAKGIEGKKGVLWWSINDIVRKRHPQFILLENVDRLLKSPTKQRGRDFGIILKCLYDEGYAVEWRVINAAEYGDIQRRRRTFIFAFKDTTKQFARIKKHMETEGEFEWLVRDGFFAESFPVKQEHHDKKKSTELDLDEYEDLVTVSDMFHAAFYNSGVMYAGKIYSEELSPDYNGPQKLLGDIVLEEPVNDKYFISQDQIEKWKYMKGSKKIERTSKEGFIYQFSEGAIAFPDPLDRPARTMLTSEGTANRSSHVITDKLTGKYRRLTPEECERINGFDTGWTDTGTPERQRYFIMGNALVVPLIEKMGEKLLEIM